MTKTKYNLFIMNCYLTQISFFTEILPVVEFQLEEDMTDEEAERLLFQSDSRSKDSGNEEPNQWKADDGDAQALNLEEETQTSGDPFTNHLSNFNVSYGFQEIQFVVFLYGLIEDWKLITSFISGFYN